MMLFSQPSPSRAVTVRRFLSAVALFLPIQLIAGLPAAQADCKNLKGSWVDKEFRFQLKPHVHGNEGSLRTGVVELCDGSLLRFKYKLKHRHAWSSEGQKFVLYKMNTDVNGEVDIRGRGRDKAKECAKLPRDWGKACVHLGDTARVLAGG